ncbi:hypothetical protein BU26DRAFT_548447 [Trematosphaeria pertusa]|uniref:F-box domain-containing protein n=1 Tax=Trematosphaeria pertusa TaxID=390896 RepID=A0A6A6IQ34_9PLEO|nr:uncharacterized protein BU26DRAFT_548447 [Trematosphaeria pertusa]KAF2251603.1 hypothetical protein BU26DRAFT_548447 [Trematosphaeria pertusa]
MARQASEAAPPETRTCHSLWYLDYYDVPHHLKPPPRIFELPDELLLSIVSNLSKNSDLCRLSLVSRKLRDIAQEALVKEAILPENGIRKFLDVLCSRSDLAFKIKSVDLGDYQSGGSPGKIFDLDRDNLFRKCRRLVDSINGAGHFSKILKAIGKGDDTFWTTNRQYFLDVLVAVAPNLRELTLELPGMSALQVLRILTAQDDSEPQTLVSPFQGPALQLLRERLRVLTISEMSAWKGLRVHNVTFRGLSQLARLTLPLNTLISPEIDPPDAVEALPPNIERLQIRPCNRHILRWLLKFGDSYVDRRFPKLRRIELFFKSCLRTSLLLVDQGRGVLKLFHELVQLMSRAGLTITAYSGKDGNRNGLLEELDAWSHLSEFETWLAATKGQQFSAAVARFEDGVPRRRTKEETRLFLRGHRPPANLRTSCEFKPKISLEGIPSLKFDKDMEPATDKATCSLDDQAWKKICSFYDIKEMNNSTSSKPGQTQATDESEKSTNSLPPVAALFPSQIEPCLGSQFNANEWLGVTFFTASKPAPKWSSKRPKQARGRISKTSKVPDQRSPTPRPRRLKEVG